MRRVCFLLSLLLLSAVAVGARQLEVQDTVASQVFWKGSSGPYNIDWSAANLKATRSDTGAVVFDARAEAADAWKDMVRDSPGASLEFEQTYRLLSIVGPYLSFQEFMSCDCGGAHPTEHTEFRTVDLSRAGSAAKLTAIFPDSQVLTALLDDRIVKNALGNTTQKSVQSNPKSLEELLDALDGKTVKLKDCSYGIYKDTFLSNFALYDFKDEHAAVRISLSHAAEVCRGQMTQLGLSLPAPESLRTSLSDAKQHQSGLLMIDAPHDGDTQVTSFKFAQ